MKHLAIAFLLLATAGPTLAAQAPPCGPKDAVAKMLSDRYGERQLAAGLSANLMFRFFANSDSGSWSIEVVDTKGTACIIAAGGDVVVETKVTSAAPARQAKFDPGDASE